MEIWRDIPDYEGSYQVSDFANVKSLERKSWNGNMWRNIKERILKPTLAGKGYYYVTLHRRSFKVSVLVAMAFLNHKPCGHKTIVDHKDNIKTNDYLSNLQLITNRKNASKDRFRGNYSSKYVGVSLDKDTNKFRARIRNNGKYVHLGLFDIEEEASDAYQDALKDIKFLEFL